LKRLQYAGQVYDEKELREVIKSVTDLRIASGPYVEKFEHGVEEKLKNRASESIKCLAVNSGSSANLLAVSSLCSAKLGGKRRARPGDEVITVACGFPATVAPIVQNGLVPVFVDIDIPTYNANIASLKAAISEKTVAIFLAHTLGNPFNLKEVLDVCQGNNLWLIEDNCDSFGSRYFENFSYKNTGTFGHISTMSFYPPHHITTGEGGMVVTKDALLYKVAKSLRDWGRDCHCPPGKDNSCLRRFDLQHGDLPKGYDHKYVYSHLGYNLKMVEPCGALGVVQLTKLAGFTEKRKRNWGRLKEGLKDVKDFILPEAEVDSDPSWFSFMITMREEGRREKIVSFLEGKKGIQTRPLFSGNILRHPCFTEYDHKHRVVGDLHNSDKVMNDGFMVGVYPGLSDSDIDYMIEALRESV
jgi:CDP-6-deoxy-D-xylo-4-hexulose-3-dehydrase